MNDYKLISMDKSTKDGGNPTRIIPYTKHKEFDVVKIPAIIRDQSQIPPINKTTLTK